jgi:hypothetical protein
MGKRMLLLFVVLLILTGLVWGASWLSIKIRGQPLDMSFLGALIGAAGTIFAATIAYVAVQIQLDAAKAQAADNAKMQQTFQKQQAKSELANLRLGRNELADLLSQFDGVSTGGYPQELGLVVTPSDTPPTLLALHACAQ